MVKRILGLCLVSALFVTAFATVAEAANVKTHTVPGLKIVNPLDGDTVVFKNSGLNSTVGVKVAGCFPFDDPNLMDHFHGSWRFVTTANPNRWTPFAMTSVKVEPFGSSSLATNDTFNCDFEHSYYAATLEFSGAGISPGALIDINVYSCGDGAPNYNDDRNGHVPTVDTAANDCDNDGDTNQYNGWDTAYNVVVGNRLDFVAIDLTYPKNGDDISSVGFTATWTTSSDAEDSAVALCPGLDVDSSTGNIGTVPDFVGVPAGCVYHAGEVVATNAANTTWKAVFTDPEVSTNTHYVVWAFADPTVGGAGPFDFDAATATFDRSYAEARAGVDIPSTLKTVWINDAAPGDHTCTNGSSTYTSQIDPYGLAIFPAVNNFPQDDPILLICVENTALTGLNGIKLVSEIQSQPAGGGSCVDADTLDDAYNPTPGSHPDPDPRFGNVNDGANQNPLIGTGTNPCSVYHPQSINTSGEYDELDGAGNARAYVNAIKVGTTVIRTCVDENGNNTCDAGELTSLATLNTTSAGRDHNHVWKAGTESDDFCHGGLSNISLPAGQSVQLVGCVSDSGHNPSVTTPPTQTIWRIANAFQGVGAPGFFTGTPDAVSNAAGKSFATFSSNPIDAGKTAQVSFCGDADLDGICDFNPAVLEIHIGGGPTGTVGTTVTLGVSPVIGVIGTPFHLAGSVADVNSPSQSVGGGAVVIQRRYVGSLDWATIGTATTIGSGLPGQGSFTFTDNYPTAGGYYRAIFGGGGGFATSTSNAVRIWVRVGISLNPGNTALVNGQSARLVGRVQPGHATKIVVLQSLTSLGWHSIVRQVIGVDNFFVYNVDCGTGAFSHLYRVAFPTQDADHSTNVSRNVRVTCLA